MLASHLYNSRYIYQKSVLTNYTADIIDARDYPLASFSFEIVNASNTLNADIYIYAVYNRSNSITEIDPVNFELAKIPITNSVFSNSTLFFIQDSIFTSVPYLQIGFVRTSGGNPTESLNVQFCLKTLS